MLDSGPRGLQASRSRGWALEKGRAEAHSANHLGCLIGPRRRTLLGGTLGNWPSFAKTGAAESFLGLCLGEGLNR